MFKRYFGNHCESYIITSVTPKRLLETQFFEKKAVFPVKKIFWPLFSRIFDCDKPHKTVCSGPKGLLAITAESIRSFFLHQEVVGNSIF